MAANRYCLPECEYFFTVDNFHTDPGHIHKASVVVAVVAQAVWVCIPHTAGLVLVDNWDTEVLDHSGRGHNPAVVLDSLVGLDTAAVVVDNPAVGAVLDMHLAADHIASFHQGNIAGSCLLEDLVHHDCIGPHNSLPGLSTAVVGLAAAVCMEESVSDPSCDFLG